MYHIDIHGEAADCNAKSPASCPRSKTGDPHFNSMSDALIYANKKLVEKYGAMGASVSRRSEHNRDILKGAFAKMDGNVTFEEKLSGNGKRLISAKGKKVDYLIKEVPNGKAFVYYTRDGVQIRPSSWHENVEEAQTAVDTFEHNW